ncbi:MAG: rhomboid family intramembrane serine protease [Spirochaetales bacterium]|nr:MAG: rhomboid family intramembrane serine protease [Spirochaetales bacterium]
MGNSLIRRPFTYRFYNAVIFIVGLNVLVFLLSLIAPTINRYLALNPVYFIKGHYYWQVVTYMFAHANMTHILFNMLGLFFFGMQLERRMGSTEFILFYLLTGMLAGVFSLIVYTASGSNVWLLGASGAVFAVLLGFATYFPDARIFIFGIFPIKAPYLVLGYTAIELVSQLFGRGTGVAHLTHLAGFGFALLYLIIRLNINPIKVFLGKDRQY